MNNKLLLTIGIVIIVIGVIIFSVSGNDKNQLNYGNSGLAGDRTLFINGHQNMVDSKNCEKNSDCELTKCGGCFNKEFLKDASPDLPCSKFEGYYCSCQYNQCTENKR